MAIILDLDRKYQILIVVFISIFLVLTITAITLSNIKFEPKVEGSVAVILNDGDLIINYVDGNEISFNDNKEHKYGVTLTNTSNKVIYYSIGFKDSTDNANVVAEDGEGNEINSMGANINTKKIINLYSIKGGETVRYSLKIKSKKGAFKGTILATNESLTTQTFSDILLLNHNVMKPKTRIGSEISTVKEGLISMQDNTGTSYFFRGVVDDNYLKMGDYLFRVVRINGDETVRVVLDGVLDKQVAYNTNTVEKEEDYPKLALLTQSSVLQTLNNWVNDKLKPYSAYFANGYFCTENNFNKPVSGINYTSSYERLFLDNAPDLTCDGTLYQSKVGFLSADEVVLAGAYRNVPNTKYYLYNEDIKGSYLTTSGYYRNVSGVIGMMNVLNDGSLGDGALITTPAYLRPVLNISVNAKLKGEGTKDNPYIIVS